MRDGRSRGRPPNRLIERLRNLGPERSHAVETPLAGTSVKVGGYGRFCPDHERFQPEEDPVRKRRAEAVPLLLSRMG